MQKLTNFLIITALALGFWATFLVALHSIDNITARDCSRGITSACKYVK